MDVLGRYGADFTSALKDWGRVKGVFSGTFFDAIIATGWEFATRDILRDKVDFSIHDCIHVRPAIVRNNWLQYITVPRKAIG